VAVLRSDLDIIISPVNIQHGKEHLALKLLKDVGDLRYRVYVVDCPFVDFLVEGCAGPSCCCVHSVEVEA
jgi:hypothetical protein